MIAERAAAANRGRLPMAASLVCFVVYAVNVLLGKAAVALKWNVQWRLDDVSEFLVVVACVAFFVIGILARERSSAEDGK